MARGSREIPELDLDDLHIALDRGVVTERPSRIPHFTLSPGPEKTWPSPTRTLPRLPLRILATEGS
ncbi:hypothetical protein A5684_10575 [Mycobacterium intracellulare]|uniref:hypothetical protein n=1 Tax=Mycobacterium intracellulare TaxID=1767 RepID=UPI0007EA36B4|nr:hypothetical protein [Mycobacterium intracellulare]OBH64070.1 hypothetical protein A5684_10575 [Mycobacterium intracellulare]